MLVLDLRLAQCPHPCGVEPAGSNILCSVPASSRCSAPAEGSAQPREPRSGGPKGQQRLGLQSLVAEEDTVAFQPPKGRQQTGRRLHQHSPVPLLR